MKPVSSHAIESAPAGASRRGFLGLLGGALVATSASLVTKAAVAAPNPSALLPGGASAMGAAASVAPSLRPVATSRGVFTMLDHLSLDAFSAQLNTPFRVPDANISLELIDARDTSREDSVRFYQLVMRGPLEPVLTSDTHLLRHAAMGDMALFISPFKQDKSGTFYHITFGHLVDHS